MGSGEFAGVLIASELAAIRQMLAIFVTDFNDGTRKAQLDALDRDANAMWEHVTKSVRKITQDEQAEDSE
jgi:hypothetical protein